MNNYMIKCLFKTIACLIIMAFSFGSFALYTDGNIMQRKITTYDPNHKTVVVSPGLDFSTSIKVDLAGVPARYEMVSSEGKTTLIRLTIAPKDAHFVQYEYYLDNGEISMVNSAGSRVLSPKDSNDFDVYFTTLNLLSRYQTAICSKIGLEYDQETRSLNIDQPTFLKALGIPSDYMIAATISDGKVNVALGDGNEHVASTYDLDTGSITHSGDVKFADGYQMDLTKGPGLIAINDPYGSVSAAGVGTVVSTSRTMLSYAAKASAIIYSHISSQAIILKANKDVIQQQYGMMIALSNIVKKPMTRPTEPDITDIIWIDKANGLVRIKGTAARADEADLNIYIITPDGKTTLSIGAVSWSGNNWETVNYANRLKLGHNKVNVIVRKADGREVESGDASVYIGQTGAPDLILVSPRDRQVYDDPNMNLANSTYIRLQRFKGKLSVGCNLYVNGDLIPIQSNGSFELPIDYQMKEGGNVLAVIVSGAKEYHFNKTIYGARKYAVNNKSQAFVLRRGDFVFNGTPTNEEGSFLGHPAIPMDPDHTGVYIGNGKVAEAKLPFVKTVDLKSWDNIYFYYAAQVPRLVDEVSREKVSKLILTTVGSYYKAPVQIVPRYNLPITIAGFYKPGDGGYYCSELAFWGWSTIAKKENFDFGINKQDIYFPQRYNGNDSYDSILPAYLCEMSMETKQTIK